MNGKQTPEELAEEIAAQDAEAARLLDSDPTYKQNIKQGEPIDETDRQD